MHPCQSCQMNTSTEDTSFELCDALTDQPMG